MTQQIHLTGSVEGQGYDQRLSIYFGRTKLFDYWLYSLVSSNEKNELQLNLNFDGNEFLPHTVKTIGDMIIFVPTFMSIEFIHTTKGLPGLDWRQYIERIAPKIFIFSKQDWMMLWDSLKISLSNLPKITEATSDDIFLLWLISSNFHPEFSLVSFFPEYAKILASSILAEDPESFFSVKEILHKVLKNEISLDVTDCQKPINGFHVIAYLFDKVGSTKNWDALYFKNDGQVGILLDDWYVRLII